jgi:hypothetical protein
LVVCLAGLAALAVIAISVASWPEILASYHLHVLRTDRASLPMLLRLSRTSSQERALFRFLQTPAGRRRLFECCIEGHIPSPRSDVLTEALQEYVGTAAGQQALRETFLAGVFLTANKNADWATVPAHLERKDWDKVVLGFPLRNCVVDGFTYEMGRQTWHVTANGGGGGGHGSLQDDRNVVLLNIIDFLKYLQPGSFPVPEYPALEYRIGRQGDHYVWCEVTPR